jgi:hypothetical protein
MLIEHAPMILLLVSLGGVLLVALGIRGRRINDHPSCRRCGFDLLGVHPGGAACPECGSDLRRPRRVRRGVRERRPRVLAGGALLLLVALVIVCTGAWLMAAGPTLNAHKPLVVLALEGRHLDPTRSKAAADEVVNRINAGALSAGQMRLVVRTALDLQADVSRVWVPEWGDVVESVRFTSPAASDEDYARFQRQSVRVDVRVRDRVQVGGRLPVLVGVVEWRRAKAPATDVAVWIDAIRVDSKAVEWVNYGAGKTALVNSERGLQVASTASRAWGGGSPAPGDTAGFELEAPSSGTSCRVELLTNTMYRTQGRPATNRVPGGWVALDTGRVFSMDVSLTAGSTCDATGVDPGVRAAVAAYLGKSTIMLSPGARGPDDDASVLAHVWIPRMDPPVAMAFRVLLRVRGAEHALGTYRTGQAPVDGRLEFSPLGVVDGLGVVGYNAAMTVADIPSDPTEAWELVLTPDVRAGEGTLDTTAIYGEPVVLRIVPKRPG